jgi:DoxX-like family
MRATTEIHASEAALAAPTQRHPLSSAAMPTPRLASGIGFWIVTVLFCVQMCFTAYAQLRLPQVAAAFTHLGFPSYFRVELSCAKLLGVVLLLAPVPARLKEWAYAGFAIDLGSSLVAHLSVADGPEAWLWAAATAVLWALSYFFWCRLDDRPVEVLG